MKAGKRWHSCNTLKVPVDAATAIFRITHQHRHLRGDTFNGGDLLSTRTDMSVFPLPPSGGDERSISHHRFLTHRSWYLTILNSVTVISFIPAVNCVILLLASMNTIKVLCQWLPIVWGRALDSSIVCWSSNPRWMHLVASKSSLILPTGLSVSILRTLNQFA